MDTVFLSRSTDQHFFLISQGYVQVLSLKTLGKNVLDGIVSSSGFSILGRKIYERGSDWDHNFRSVGIFAFGDGLY